MRLSTLEIKGFKSFGDKVAIHFDKGVTSIVGPNGSGKSNVVDAMRWVLGEQKTRLLRSEKMENIIFNGTKSRKPANLAEVSLCFENTKNILPTEFSTVTVTRRYYRSGESEYLLNGVNCRLKDITDLFLDTGIGPDSYSIIELKMIDDIINDRNNTLRILLEEAAGISKYKIRKKQTFQKLEDTDADLSRVLDLLFEIEKNLRSLESQAKKAEKYYRIKEEYRQISTQVAVFSILSYKTSFEQLQEQEQQQSDQAIQIDSQIDYAEAANQKLKLENVDLEKHLAASQKALNDRIAFIRQKENDKKLKNERLRFLSDKEESLEKQLSNDKPQVEQLNLEIEYLSNEQQDLGEQNAASQKLLVNFRTELELLKNKVDELQQQNGEKSKQAQSLQEQIFRQEKILAIQQTQQEALLQEKNRLQQDIEQRENEENLLKSNLEAITDQKEQIESRFEQIENQEFEKSENEKNKNEELNTLNIDLQQFNRKLDAKQNEFNLLKSLVENLEGFPESIKYLKKKSGLMQDIPLLSDILVCQTLYKTTLEYYLEPFMNHFVVKTMSQALEAIEKLSKENQGRAHFFILEYIENKQAIPAGNTQAVAALDLVQVDQEYQNLVNFLLHNVHVLENGVQATAITKQKDIVYLSASAKFQLSAHSISGGSVGLFDGKRLGRAKSLEFLGSEIAELQQLKHSQQAQLEEKKKQFQTLQEEIKNFKAQKNIIQLQLNQILQQHTALHTRLEQSTKNVKSTAERLAVLNAQLLETNSNADGNFDVVQNEIIRLKNQKEDLQNQLISLQQALNENSQVYNISQTNYNTQNIEFVQLQNKLNTLHREINFKKSQVELFQKNISSNSEDLQKVKLQIEDLMKNGDDADEDMIALYDEKESLEKAVAEQEVLYFKAKGEIDQQENQLRELRRRKEQGQLLIQSIKDKINDIKIQLNSLKERLSVEFQIEIENIMAMEPEADWNEEELRSQLEKLRQQINNFGPINPMAVEAYNEIKERHDFIVAQKLDLENAKASLLETIKEIDSTAREKYMEAYQHIRENFVKVFRSLFTEDDTCDLVLSDPSNPLDCDVNIFAQPKGKRPQSLSQLSSGEKTLTATALLFSVYLLKPAPFCIFDEVDAPLDDANIDKFNNIIQRFSGETQFIVITHNKRTMSYTDIIYGITMVETGVTQAVPVDLREVQV